MVNGQKVCHGGLIFMLADSSFGFACNGHNQRALARHGIYDVRAANQSGDTVALFRGKSATVKGNWVMKDG